MAGHEGLNGQDHLLQAGLPEVAASLQAGISRNSRLAPAIEVGENALRELLNQTSTLSAESLIEIQRKAITRIIVGLNSAEAAEMTKTGEVNSQSLIDLEQVLTGEGPRVIFMRHGTQFSDLPDKKDKMRLPANMTEPLTDISMAQAVATAVALSVIAGRLGKPLQIISSENERALQTAAIIAGVAGADLIIDRSLNCVNYPPKNEVNDDELNKLLGEENNGALLWQENRVDKVCGPGTFQRISRDMSRLLARLLLRDNNAITIVVTHTQQTNAADVVAGNAPLRLRDLGMRTFSPSESVLIANGIFS